MCGIAGFMALDGKPVAEGTAGSLAQALGHRGPDGQGSHVNGDVVLVHTRLAIIDLETGDQPFLAEDGTALVANGEIYNDPELRASLPDIRFRSRSDCEPPLHLYRRAGPDFVSRLRGMYALALHDVPQGRLILARDPFGIKPLYYAETPAGFAFASEPQALLRSGLVEPRLRRDKLGELLQLQFTTGPDSIFDSIRRVLPGETIVVEKGRVVARRRLDALPPGVPEEIGEAEALRRFDTILTDSVGHHQRADVPYGMFLSGGIDSSVLLALMARLNPTPVLAYTAGFSGTAAHDERDHARELARITGARHVEVDFGERDFWTLLPQVAAALDDPAADYATLPTFKLAQVARQDVKVVLSGEGGDELFGGYGRYRSAIRPWPLARRMRRRGTFDGLDVLREAPRGWRDGIAAAERAQAETGRSRLQAVQAVDCADWLPNDLLIKLDRCLMAHGVEGRVPFLDLEVARFAFRLPDRLKLQGKLGKWIVRKWLETALPEAKPFSRKRGFTVPVGEWIAARPELGPLLASQPAIAEICKPGRVEALCQEAAGKTGFAAWSLLFYALWHRHHVEGRPGGGDVFDALAAR
ncbi:asparagine synthase (glutamine-hydrolyzing) [Telmatospirillum sp. J64-1]|uniref:asparagine synthase (glutamine-hydrolyzing) n=1 Tax=Telmatospirillum sp. J64-1 TaxID=2502183 RepID=UPI00115EB020|nr:asparagine synthase (glutamine-hydrolyzing) [Telmatospirillum sp. J64-1]